MTELFTVTFPFFALVLLGWLCCAGRILPLAAVTGLNSYVLYVALPAMLFQFGRSLPLSQLLNPHLLGAYTLAAVCMVGITFALGRWQLRRAGRAELQANKDAAYGALTAAFPNSGFMGVPLLVALLGAGAAGPIITTIVVDMLFTSTLCIALAHGGHGAARALGAVLRNPMPWGIALGAAAGHFDVPLPGPGLQVVSMLAQSASPVALFAIGAVLYRAGASEAGHTPVALTLPVALLKLLLHPMLVGGTLWTMHRMGVALPAGALVTMTLHAALPSASNVILLSERDHGDTGRIVGIIMLSTVLAFASFTLLAWALGVQAAH